MVDAPSWLKYFPSIAETPWPTTLKQLDPAGGVKSVLTQLGEGVAEVDWVDEETGRVVEADFDIVEEVGIVDETGLDVEDRALQRTGQAAFS